MRNTLIICAFFVLLAFANAETLSKARLRGMTALERDLKSESAFLSMKDTPFGKNLFSMMSLKFQATGKLDSLNKLLAELQQNIKDQQSADDQQYQTTSTAYTNTINEQASVITTATNNIASWSQILIEKRSTLQQKQDQQRALEHERDSITDFLAQLKITRENEVANFNQRIEDQNAMVEGLTEVIQIFGIEVDQNQNLDRAAAQNVLELLNNIKASLIASIADDTNAETTAAAKYAAFVAAQNSRLGEIRSELQALAIEIASLQSEITTLEGDIQRETQRKAAAETLKAQTEAALEALTKKYNDNKAVRTEQLSLIQQVQARLNQNPDNVQQFLNAA